MLKGLLTPLLISLTLYGCAGPSSRVVDPRTLPFLTIEGELYTQGYSALDPGQELRLQIRRHTRNHSETITDIPMSPPHVTSNMPFALTAIAPNDPATVDELQVLVLRNQQLEYASDPVILTLTLDPIVVGSLLLRPADEISFGRSYDCGDQPLVYGQLGGQPQLLARGRLHRLQSQGHSEAGERYRSVEQPTTQVVDNGERLLVALADKRLPECYPRAPLPLPQTARGEDPGWYLHLSSQLLQFEKLGSQERYSAALLGALGGGTAQRYLGADQFVPLQVEFGPQLCRLDQSPLPYPYTVTVTTHDAQYRGCGGAPETLLTDRYWRINRLGDMPPVSRAPLTLRFEADGRLSGYSACNRFTSTWSVEGDQLAIGKLAATKMACRANLATQEQLLFGLLEGVQRFNINDAGALLLEGSLGDIKAFTDPRQLRD